MATTNNKYIIKKMVIGDYDYDTVFIEKDKVEYQVPVIKGKDLKVDTEIEIKNIFEPIK